MTVNFFGFMPFGFLLATIFGKSLRSNWKVFLATTATGFLLSFMIELIQAWMPSRDSSQLDVLMNTCGTLLGAWFAKLVAMLLREPAAARDPSRR